MLNIVDGKEPIAKLEKYIPAITFPQKYNYYSPN